MVIRYKTLYKHDFSFEKPWEAKKRSNTLLIDLNQNTGMMKIEIFMFYFDGCFIDCVWTNFFNICCISRVNINYLKSFFLLIQASCIR